MNIPDQPKHIDANGRRSTTADTYLHRSSLRNLRVMTRTTVSRVIVEQTRAVGVELCEKGSGGALRARTVMARKMVIRAAGRWDRPRS